MHVPRYQYPALALVVVAIASFIAPSLVFGPHAGDTVYSHTIHPPTNETDCDPEYTYADLSAPAQDVVDTALSGTTVRRYGDGIDDFRYPGLERRFVRHDILVDGKCVLLYTSVQQQWGEGIAVFFGRVFAVIGLVTAAVALVLRRPRVTIIGYAIIPTVPSVFVFGIGSIVLPVVVGIVLWVVFGAADLGGKHPA